MTICANPTHQTGRATAGCIHLTSPLAQHCSAHHHVFPTPLLPFDLLRRLPADTILPPQRGRFIPAAQQTHHPSLQLLSSVLCRHATLRIIQCGRRCDITGNIAPIAHRGYHEPTTAALPATSPSPPSSSPPQCRHPDTTTAGAPRGQPWPEARERQQQRRVQGSVGRREALHWRTDRRGRGEILQTGRGEEDQERRQIELGPVESVTDRQRYGVVLTVYAECEPRGWLLRTMITTKHLRD